MHIKMFIYYSLIKRLACYKLCLCFIVLLVTVCTVGYVCSFCGDQIFMDFVSFLSMIIYKILYTWCLRYNICSAWFLCKRISTCYSTGIANTLSTHIGWEGGMRASSHKLVGKGYVNTKSSKMASIGAISPPHITQSS